MFPMTIESLVDKREDGYYMINKYYTSHTGMISIKVEEGKSIKEGDVLYTITRLNLIKKKVSETAGVVKK